MSDETIATLPPPWNADVVSCSWETRANNDLVEYFDHKPQPPRKWTDEVSDEDSDGNWWTVEEPPTATLVHVCRACGWVNYGWCALSDPRFVVGLCLNCYGKELRDGE